MSSEHTIIYTFTDEAPALATRSLLPIVNAFTKAAGVGVDACVGVGVLDRVDAFVVEGGGFAGGRGGALRFGIAFRGRGALSKRALQHRSHGLRWNGRHDQTKTSWAFLPRFQRNRSRMAECIWLTRLSERSRVEPISFMVMPSK